MSDATDAFTKIYNEHHWGGSSRSGPGSDPKLLHSYLELLTTVIKERSVLSVVDAGCGDWALAKTLDWSGVDYTGIDIVPDLVNRLNNTFGKRNIRFVGADLITSDLPIADLCVIKDVLQHLSNASVNTFLTRLESHFKYALITNDMTHKKQGRWRSVWKSLYVEPNSDIPDGGYRPLRLTEPPFCLRATRLAIIPFRFNRQVFGHPGVVFETKEVLLWKHNNKKAAV